MFNANMDSVHSVHAFRKMLLYLYHIRIGRFGGGQRCRALAHLVIALSLGTLDTLDSLACQNGKWVKSASGSSTSSGSRGPREWLHTTQLLSALYTAALEQVAVGGVWMVAMCNSPRGAEVGICCVEASLLAVWRPALLQVCCGAL